MLCVPMGKNKKDLLEVVFENGRLTKDYTLGEIRKRLNQ